MPFLSCRDACLLGLLSATPFSAASQTTFIHEVSSDWGDDANWSNLRPDSPAHPVPLLAVIPDITPEWSGAVRSGRITVLGDLIVDTGQGGAPNQIDTKQALVSGRATVASGIWNADGDFVLNGVLEVHSGGKLTSSGVVRFGDDLLSSASVSIRDAGSEFDATLGVFNASRYTFVGDGGTGDLEILDGAILRSFHALIGGGAVAEDPGGGVVMVRGTDALWDIKNSLVVGFSGPGTLDIESGGIVRTVQDVRVGDRFDGERGDITVLGQGSLLAVGTPTSGQLQIGEQNIGTLRVGTGGDVYSYGGSVGDRLVVDDGGERIENGTVEISGEGSLWDVRDILWVGRMGEGVIDVLEGGLLDVGETLEIGGEDEFDTATSEDGGKGLVRADGAGSRIVGKRVLAGIDGEGRLDALHDAQVDLTGDLYVGGNSQDLGNFLARGLVTIRTGASLLVRDVYVGNDGNGEVHVSDGGVVESSDLRIGYQIPEGVGRASATITGPDSTWTMRSVDVGHPGPGDFVVANGALVVNVSFGSNSGQSRVNPTGIARVSGPFARWQSRGMAVFGQLVIEAGGTVTSTFGTIASTGSASVTQGGSRWDLPQLGVEGTLSVANGGQVNVNGELTIEPTGIVILDPGGTLRVDELDDLGTIQQNGGTLVVDGTIVVPEPGGPLAASIAMAALAVLVRRRAGAI